MAQRTALVLTLLSSFGLVSYACGGKGDGDSTQPDEDGEGGGSNEDGDSPSKPKPEPGGTSTLCQSDKACTAQDQICDIDRAVCVDCLSDDDCSKNAECLAGSCVPFTPCKSSKDCSVEQVCNSELERCVECVTSRDCEDGDICAHNSCRPSCASDKDCRSLDQVCHGDEGYCVECLVSDDCGKNEHCTETNSCQKNICVPDETVCNGDDLFTCNSEGTRFTRESCARGCVEDDGPAHCEQPPAGSCNRKASTSPCDSLPRFTGTQIVDGSDEDFCDVPYYELTPQNAGFVADSSATLVSPSETMISKARVRIAWSPGFFHAHVRVTDPLRNTGTSNYDGDNVQFFLASAVPTNSTITSTCSPAVSDISGNGIRPADAKKGLQQLYLLPEEASGISAGGYAARFSANCSYDTEATDWTVRNTEDGYELELKYPWAIDYDPQKSGQQIGFDLMIGVNDRASVDGRQYEYGLYMDPKSSTACSNISATKGLWCDTSLWCTPTLAN